jgi:CheY-like chemotaxis protein
VDIDFQTMVNLYHNKERGNDISALIVDFKMPKLTGLELMKQILPSAIKRILLTGEAENELAIAAFNANTIDRFVHKGDSSFAADLRLYVKQMTTQYFCDLTKPLLAHMEVEHRLPQSDPVFIDFFDKWACLNNIVEYFVFDKNGSMLVADQQGQVFYFIIHTEKTLDEFSELHASDKSVKFFVNAVMQRYKIPFFGLFREAWEFESTQWTNHFYSPEVLQGRERYYWKAIAE